jgi:uncharacterized membrane protein
MTQQDVLPGAVTSHELPQVRSIGLDDIKDALAKGVDDFRAMPSHAVFICLIYPILGLVLARIAFGYDVLSMLFPLAAGFALVGPFAAIGLYELSRRREHGLDADWTHLLDVRHSPSFGPILGLGLLLVAIFLIWLAVANGIYTATMGYQPAASMPEFVRQVLTTPQGWTLIIVGNLIGFLFALLVLVISVVTFPLLLDRNVGAAAAVLTSVRAVLANPMTMALWGLIVAVLLLVGSLPLFIGLAVVMPVLGHATWHLYRKVVDPDRAPPLEYREPPKGTRYAAAFPASLFARERDRS